MELCVIYLLSIKDLVRKLPSGKLEITVDAARPIEEWVRELPGLITAAGGG